VVVLDWSSINDIDYSACVELMSIVKEYKANNILFIQVRLLLRLLVLLLLLHTYIYKKFIND
jgi:hypothetical protein